MSLNSYLPHTRRLGLKKAVCRSVRALKPFAHQFDTIVVRGVSGISVGSVVAYRMKKDLVVIRKPDEGSHGYGVEGKLRERGKAVWLDDFIATGKTYFEVCAAIGGPPRFIMLYGTESGEPFTWTDATAQGLRVVRPLVYTPDVSYLNENMILGPARNKGLIEWPGWA